MKSIQIAIDALRLTVAQGTCSTLPHDRKHASAIVEALEQRVGEQRGELLALEAQLEQAREIVETIDERIAEDSSPLHPTMQAAIRPFVQQLPRAT